MKKIDIILALVTGEAVAWFFYNLLKDLKVVSGLLILLPILFPILAVFCLWISWLIGKKYVFIFQAAKFVLIGALATLADLGVFNFLGLVIASDIINKAISFIVVTFAKYWGNKFWAFEKSEKSGMQKEITQFYLITLIGLAVDVGVFSIVVKLIGPQFGIPLATWKTLGVLAASVVVSVWNFIGYKFFVFKK